ncbi:TPA: hypothetical protein ACH3X1_012843 [Trebouxia sp. C0004]
MQLPLAALVKVACVYQMLVLICSLPQQSVLKTAVSSQKNSPHQQQPACYSEDICVPAWVPLGMHVGNSVAAVLDFMACIHQRTFSMRAEYGQTVITVGYTLWLMLCKSQTGSFPYPFMEELPLPWGFILTSVFMITSCELLFGFGRRMHLMFMHHQQLANMEGGFQRHRARLEYGDDQQSHEA